MSSLPGWPGSSSTSCDRRLLRRRPAGLRPARRRLSRWPGSRGRSAARAPPRERRVTSPLDRGRRIPAPRPLRVVADADAVDLGRAEKAAAELLLRPGRAGRHGSDGRHTSADGRGVRRDAHPRSFDLTSFPNDDGYDELVLAAVDPRPLRVRAPHAAVPRRRPRRVPAGRPDPRAVQAGPSRRDVLEAAAGPGAAHHAGRALAPGVLVPQGCRRRRRGRAPVHDRPRRPGPAERRPSPRPCTVCCATTPASRAEFFALVRSGTQI